MTRIIKVRVAQYECIDNKLTVVEEYRKRQQYTKMFHFATGHFVQRKTFSNNGAIGRKYIEIVSRFFCYFAFFKIRAKSLCHFKTCYSPLLHQTHMHACSVCHLARNASVKQFVTSFFPFIRWKAAFGTIMTANALWGGSRSWAQMCKSALLSMWPLYVAVTESKLISLAQHL